MARTKDKSVIHCGNPQDADLAYMAMFRYAFGRMTYMPSVIQGIIMRNADRLTDKCLALLDRELTDEEERYESCYKDNKQLRELGITTTNYGMDFDREGWLRFHKFIKEQIKMREQAIKGGEK